MASRSTENIKRIFPMMSVVATETAACQPDISYSPDFEKYQARTRRRLETELLKSETLPSGFPKQLESDLVWEGEGLAEKYDWTYQLSPSDIQELEDALTHFNSLDKSLGYLSVETFPLPTLHEKLRAISRELHYGHGFKVVRGLPVDAHTLKDNITLHAGLSSHIAPQRARQDSKYQGASADVVLSHITDLSSSERQSIGAPAYTTDKQVFHTDTGDVVSLFALSVAAHGGTSRLASTWRVYNELAATRPDLVQTLTADWVGENFGGNPRTTTRPLMYFDTNTKRLLLQYARRYFTGFGALGRSTDIPPISEAQAEALDALHFLGEKFNIGLDFRKGDIQYLNNLAVFHARDGFTDSADQKRHLVRLWLRDPEYAWNIPEPLKTKWAEIYDGVRPESQIFPLEPYVRSASNANSQKRPT